MHLQRLTIAIRNLATNKRTPVRLLVAACDCENLKWQDDNFSNYRLAHALSSSGVSQSFARADSLSNRPLKASLSFFSLRNREVIDFTLQRFRKPGDFFLNHFSRAHILFIAGSTLSVNFENRACVFKYLRHLPIPFADGIHMKMAYQLEFAIFTLAGIPSYVWCFLRHICRCGHLVHHGNPRVAGMCDLVFMACFVIAALASYRSRLPRGPLCCFFLVALLFSRMALDSWGGGLILMEVALLIFLGIYATRTIWRLKQAHRQQPAMPTSA
jgi:hypothetical protein